MLIGGIDGQHAVDCLGAHLGLQPVALFAARRCSHIHRVVGIPVVEHLPPDLVGKGRVIGHDCDVLSGGRLVANIAAEAQKRANQQGHGNGRYLEGSAANLLHVLALGDKKHVTHWPCLLRSE